MAKKTDMKKPINRTGADRAPVTNDSRFVSVHSDPRFAMPRRKDNKIAIDKRFTRMLKDDDFAQKAAVDRYGRKLGKDAGKEEIKRYYRMEDDEDEEEEGDELETKARYDPARGEGVISSSEESSDESDEEVDKDEEEAIAKEALEDASNIPTGEVTKRLAVVNLDWDNVGAVDLMKAFSSFAPSGGKILSVTVYPSEFGRERMERENMEGPPSDIFKANAEVEDEDVDSDEEVTEKTIIKEDKGQEFDSAKLRNYQLERLRYYYAVIETDKPETAHHIYTQCDGAEYEATANFFDLRFIPDDTSFDTDTPRDQCTTTPENYKPTEFVTDALQHSKVKLTWDEDDTHRKTAAKRAFSQKEVEDMDLAAYLASSDSESESETTKERYRALLSGVGGIKKGDKPVGDMEVTFTSGLSEKDKDTKVILDDDIPETTIEKYARKERERKQRRKEKARLLKGGLSTDAPEPEAAEEDPTPATTDLGFNDPFFADTPTAPPSTSQTRKEKKAAAAALRAAEAATQISKRAELELLMADADTNELHHFDMKQVLRSEKSKKLKGKKKKRSRAAEEAMQEGAQEGFEIDVKDPRFAAVYERHEFAIDPTNPRFVKTSAMGKMLDERRRRTKRDGEVDEEIRGKRKKVKVQKGEDVGRLVESIRKKAGKR